MQASSKKSASLSNTTKWVAGTLTYTYGGIVMLFCYLLVGDFIWSLRERSVGVIARILLKQYGASDGLNGFIVISLPLAIGFFLSPFISYCSDRYRSRLGRRIPFLLVTTPIVFVGIVGMAFSPNLARLLVNLTGYEFNPVVLTVFGIAWTIFEFGVVAGNTVFSALINDVVPKNLLGRFYGLFRIVGLSAGIIFNWWLFGFVTTHSVFLFIGIGVIYVTGFLLMCFKVKEGEYPPPDLPKEGSNRIFGAVRTYLREGFGFSYYVTWFIYFVMAQLTFATVNIYCVFFCQKLGVPLDHYGKFIAISYVISLLISFPLGILADRFHPFVCSLWALGIYAIVVFTSAIAIQYELELPCSGTIFGYDYSFTITAFAVAVILHTIASGAYLTISASLPMRIFPQSHYASLTSAKGLVFAVVFFVVPPLIGTFLDWTGHNYVWTFYIDGGFALLTLGIGMILFPKFKKLGGTKNYEPPSVER